MTDAKTAELVERLRRVDTYYVRTSIANEAADLIQAQAKEIVELREAVRKFTAFQNARAALSQEKSE